MRDGTAISSRSDSTVSPFLPSNPAIWRVSKAYAAITVNESWYITQEMPNCEKGRSIAELIAEAERGLPPRLNPRRREAIALAIIGPGIKPHTRLVPFHRVAGEILFEHEKQFSEGKILMIEPWWDDEPTTS